MKVVVLKPLKTLGKIGEIVEVKDGYGRNFLIPQNIAARATPENLIQFEERKHELEEKNKTLLAEAQEEALKLEGKDFSFVRQSSDDGRLFGSVSNKEIASEVSKISKLVRYSSVILHNPIKSLGVYEVKLQLHMDVETKVIINIARTETEVLEAIKSYKAKKEEEQAETAA